MLTARSPPRAISAVAASRICSFVPTGGVSQPDGPCRGSVATGGAGGGERLAGLGHELPVVAGGVEGKGEHAEGLAEDLGVGLADGEVLEVGPAGAAHELPDAVPRVEAAPGVLGGEALVVVVVTIEDDVDIAPVEVLPDGAHDRVVAVLPG